MGGEVGGYSHNSENQKTEIKITLILIHKEGSRQNKKILGRGHHRGYPVQDWTGPGRDPTRPLKPCEFINNLHNSCTNNDTSHVKHATLKRCQNQLINVSL